MPGKKKKKNDPAELRERINMLARSLGRFFVGKQELIDLMVLCAVAQEPLLLVGPPGTAKSALVTQLRDAMGLSEQDYFEYMLTRFTEPSEILGPIDLEQMRAGHYVRRVEGKLPTAKLVFLDEVFHSNSAILNSLLTIINEHKFYQDGRAEPVAMKILFAASNDIPEQAELAALKDRFTLKAMCGPVQEEHFDELIDAGVANQVARATNQRPWKEGHATLGDFLAAHDYMIGAIGKAGQRKKFFPPKRLREMQRVINVLAGEDKVFVSDRKVIKLYRLIRTRAWLKHGGVVELDDLRLLKYLGETTEAIKVLEDKVPHILGL